MKPLLPDYAATAAGAARATAPHHERGMNGTGSYPLSAETPQQTARSNSLLRCPNLITTAISELAHPYHQATYASGILLATFYIGDTRADAKRLGPNSLPLQRWVCVTGML